MERSVEHDDGEGEDEASVRVLEDFRVELAVTPRERLHHPVNLLRLAWQPEAPEELPERKQPQLINLVPRTTEAVTQGVTRLPPRAL